MQCALGVVTRRQLEGIRGGGDQGGIGDAAGDIFQGGTVVESLAPDDSDGFGNSDGAKEQTSIKRSIAYGIDRS